MAYGGCINTDFLSEETFDFLCVVCKRKGQNSEADKFCVECKDYYCLSCVKVHEDVPSLADHKIYSKGQFPPGSVRQGLTSRKTPSQELTERCDRHSHHYIDMYCRNHDVVVCGTCIAIDHRSCQDIFYLPEYLKEKTVYKFSNKDIKRKLKKVFKTLTEQHEALTKEQQQLVDMRTTTLEYIKTFREEINEQLDELEEYTIAVMEDKCKTLLHEIKDHIQMLETNKSSATAIKQKLKVSDTTASQTFVNYKNVEAIANKAAEIVESSKLLAVNIDFTPDPRLSSLLDEMNTLGKITNNLCTQNVQKKNVYHVKSSKKYTCKVQSGEDRCDIVSACTLEDGTLLLSDYYDRKLKRLNSTSYTILDFCDLHGKPWQVCSINKQQAAVCLPDKQKVLFISLSDKMKLTNKLATDFDCYGLAYDDNDLYISDTGRSVYIYSISGIKLKQFSMDRSGQELFSNINSLAVSQDGSRIFVCDSENGIIILDRQGNVVGGFNGSELRGAYDSCLSCKGSLLVVGYDSKNVLNFDKNGELIGEVVKFDDDFGSPQAVCCNPQMSKVVTGIERDDEIVVVDFV